MVGFMEFLRVGKNAASRLNLLGETTYALLTELVRRGVDLIGRRVGKPIVKCVAFEVYFSRMRSHGKEVVWGSMDG